MFETFESDIVYLKHLFGKFQIVILRKKMLDDPIVSWSQSMIFERQIQFQSKLVNVKNHG